MSDWDNYEKYDLALREWERDSLVSERNTDDFVYYHAGLNEYRLGRYLLSLDQMADYTGGGWALAEKMPKEVKLPGARHTQTVQDWEVLGEIIGLKTESEIGTFPHERRRPGYWIVLNLGQVEIVPGSNTRKPVRMDS